MVISFAPTSDETWLDRSCRRPATIHLPTYKAGLDFLLERRPTLNQHFDNVYRDMLSPIRRTVSSPTIGDAPATHCGARGNTVLRVPNR